MARPTLDELREAATKPGVPAPLQRMHRVHGVADPPRRCGECVFLVPHVHARTYWKCSKYGETSGPATDWRKRWAACGLFESEGARPPKRYFAP